MSFADWFWEALSPNGLFYSLEERKEKSCCLCACYLLFDLKRLPRRLHLSMTRLLKTKRSIIVSDFWFEDFFLPVIDVIKPPATYFNNNIDCRISLIVDLWSSALLFLLPAFFCMLRWVQFESQQSVCNQFLQQTLHASWQVQHDTFSKNVIDLCWILYNKPRMVATFFFQWTTAFTLFSIVASLQISCFRKPKEKQYAKLNKRIVARLIWQLVIHSCVLFAYVISRRDGENNGFLEGVSLLPFLLARLSRFPRAQNPFSLTLQTPATQANFYMYI